jgi:NACalpha-BTF3-like transcription factor
MTPDESISLLPTSDTKLTEHKPEDADSKTKTTVNSEEKRSWEKMCESLAECSSLDPEEVRCVMQQAECDMMTAVKALQKNGNLVDAILDIVS